MTPTDNLEAGAGDLVRRLNVAADGMDTVSFDRLSLRRGYEKILREAAAHLASVTAENARLREALGRATADLRDIEALAAISQEAPK